MRTVLITNGNLPSLLSLGEVLRCYRDCFAAVFVTRRLPAQRSNLAGVLSMCRTSGLRYTHFKLLVNRLLPWRLRLRGLPVGVADYLRRIGSCAPVVRTGDINAPDMVRLVRSFDPEILLSFSATSRFGDALLATPRRAAINVHYALLPAYAGLSPYFWYLRNGERECGVTLHRIIAQLDAGPVIEQQRFPLAGLRTVLAVLLEQTARVSPMLVRYYQGLTSERDAVAQDLSRRSYYGHPRRADVAALLAQGYRFYERRDLVAVRQRLRRLLDPRPEKP